MLLKHVPETLLESNSVCMHPQPHDPEPFDIAGKFAPAGSSTCTTCAVGTYKGCGTRVESRERVCCWRARTISLV